MSTTEWFDRLQCLVIRFADYGVGTDVSSMSMSDLWGLYGFLDHVDGEAP